MDGCVAGAARAGGPGGRAGSHGIRLTVARRGRQPPECRRESAEGETGRFWRALKLKAHLREDFWSPSVQVSRYRTYAVEEDELPFTDSDSDV